MLQPEILTAEQDRATAEWHLAEQDDAALLRLYGLDSVQGLLVRQHLANFKLWHQEDLAREPGASDAAIAQVKRNIDRLNQHRHDVTEQIDQLLLDTAQREGTWNKMAALHSETPAMMADRLSILSLKIFHTQQEMARPHAPADHAERNAGRLLVLEQQRDDLAACLDQLWQDVLAGRRRFALYRQLKMYNDPTLNPAIYSAHAHASNS
jgi:hypothetical protein